MPRRKKIVEEQSKEEKPKSGKEIKSLRGMRDILPQDQKYWQWILDTARNILEAYGFQSITTPILEETALFKRTTGAYTDIVQKEMFSFIDQGGDKVSLRPELTPSICRAYIEHGMWNLAQPVKLYQIGPLFRYDRPQAGRFREFNQIDFETIGDNSPVVDAEIIAVSYTLLKTLGLETNVQINSIGCSICRENYIKALVSYYKPKKNFLCENCKERITKNPLRLLDCKEKSCQEMAEDAPQIVDYLDDECKTHFVKVLEFLDEFDLPYILNPKIVRGLDYYTGTTFEIWTSVEEEGRTQALAGGGRYDGLIEILGGRPTPGSGVALGVERIIARLRENNIEPEISEQYNLYLAQIGEPAKKKSLKLFEELRKEGFKIVQNLSKQGLRAQLELADKLKVKVALILGQKEIVDGTILIRDMESGIQEVVDYKKIVPELRKRIG